MTTLTAFPTVLGEVPQERLMKAYEEGPARIRASLAGLPDEALAAPARGPETWSIQEIVLHLADAEVMGAARTRQVLAQTGATMPLYDQNEWAERLGYRSADRVRVHEALDMFESLRRATGRLLRGAGKPDWQRTGLHLEWGSLTLRQLLELYADHSERHLAQILAIRTLVAAPLDMPLLIEERLY